MSLPSLRILVVDDTAVYRKILVDTVESVGVPCEATACPGGRLALARLDAEPADLVLLDVEMPEMDGLETLREIRRRHSGTDVVMVSGLTARAATVTVEALNQGALDFIRKPEGLDAEASRAELREVLRPILRHVETRRNLRAPSPEPGPAHPRPPSVARAPRPSRLQYLAIGVSTGGPNALAEVIPALPADLGVPVLVVQHMPPLFTASLAEHLDRKSKLAVKEAVEGEEVLPGRVYLAPGGRHMVLRRAGEASSLIIGLNDHPPVHSCRPSVDVLFRSLAAHCDGKVLAVVMTGMGSDGCEGVRALKRGGCHCLTQSEGTCVVYGMPQAVDEAGLSDERVPLPALAGRIADLIRAGSPP